MNLRPTGSLPPQFRTHLEPNYRTSDPMYKLNLALEELPRYTAAPAEVPLEVVGSATTAQE
ncbi:MULTISPECIES: hypothetical protein [unclassified Synechococcus]|uniref:hypothetical protein n=1 Tax=unclassified Synechococcus TaxID=2626047 RepID=UPI0039C28BFD